MTIHVFHYGLVLAYTINISELEKGNPNITMQFEVNDVFRNAHKCTVVQTSSTKAALMIALKVSTACNGHTRFQLGVTSGPS